jgi:hypothetical protein
MFRTKGASGAISPELQPLQASDDDEKKKDLTDNEFRNIDLPPLPTTPTTPPHPSTTPTPHPFILATPSSISPPSNTNSVSVTPTKILANEFLNGAGACLGSYQQVGSSPSLGHSVQED